MKELCTKKVAWLLVAMAAATAQGQLVGPVDLIKNQAQDQVVENDGGIGLPPNMPPLNQIPSAPMPQFDGLPGFDPNAPSSVTVYNAETREIRQLPARFGIQPSGEGGTTYVGDAIVNGGDFEAGGFGERSLSDMTQTTESGFPARVACKVAMRFTTNTGGTAWYVCSGSMIDAETVLLAAHCIFNRESNIMDWAEEVYVFPGWDGNGDETPSGLPAGIFNHYGYGRATSYIAGSNYVNNGDWDADMAVVRVTRAVGMLTGWFGWAWGGDCNSIQNRTYLNYSYPSEGCGGGLHTGEDMLYRFGTVDSCPGNQFQFDTTPGCFSAVWGGMSGSSLYYISGGNRYSHGVCSTSNRSSSARWSKMWEAFKNSMVDFIADSRGSALDLQALDCNFGPTSINAGEYTTTANVLIVNPTNNDPANRTYTYRVYLSLNSDITTSDILLATRTFTADFAAIGSTRLNIGNVLVPENVAPGSYFMGVILDNATDGVSSNNDTDEWDAVPVTILPPIPDNNACSVAFNLPLDTIVNGTNALATNDGTTSCSSSSTQRDVWYRFTAPFTDRYIIETLGGGTLADTVVSVHSGCPGTSANTIECDNNSGAGTLSLANFDGIAGVTYRVRVAGLGSATGTFNLQARVQPPANDTCGPFSTSAVIGANFGDNRGATNDGDTTCGGSSATTGSDVWYTFVPICSGVYTFDTEGSDTLSDTVISIHSGCPGTPANTIACNDDGGSGFLSYLEANLQALSTYNIRVTGYGGSEGAFQLNIGSTGSADSCSRPDSVLTEVPTNFSTCSATASADDIESGCRLGDNGSVGPDVWFRWRATCSGTATASICGASYDSKMVVYNGTCPDQPRSVRVACSDDSCGDDARANWACTAGTTYLIRIGGSNGSILFGRGSGILNVTCVTPCPWNADGCFADFNEDDGIDGDDVIAFFSDWDANRSCADVDDSGGVDSDDIITFFQAWDVSGSGFPGC